MDTNISLGFGAGMGGYPAHGMNNGYKAGKGLQNTFYCNYNHLLFGFIFAMSISV